jgi:glutamate dehydrogenase (NAD(P)+)
VDSRCAARRGERRTAAVLDTRIVAEGANIPCTPEAEVLLAQRSVLVLPDLVVNAGGVICAAIEYHGGAGSAAFGVIEEKVRRNTVDVLETARRTIAATRDAAIAMATERVNKAARARRWG